MTSKAQPDSGEVNSDEFIEEDSEEAEDLSPLSIFVKKWTPFVIRHILSTLFCLYFFNMNYSPIYLHGYLFAIHQEYNYTKNHTKGDVGEGAVLEYQATIFPTAWRVSSAILTSLAIWAILKTRNVPTTTWRLYAQSILLPSMIVMLRCQHEGLRIITQIHSWFYYYVVILVASWILCFRSGPRRKLSTTS